MQALLILDLTVPWWPVIACSEPIERVTGIDAESMIGRSWFGLWNVAKDGAPLHTLRRAIEERRGARVTLRNQRGADHPIPTSVTVGIGAGERGPTAVVILRSEVHDDSWLAHHDPLTGLANRRLLARDLDIALLRAARHHRSVALLFVDLDRFKPINDELGHVAGDEVLRQVAERLKGCVRAHDLVARLGGDEFVVMLTDIEGPSRAQAEIVAEHIHQALREPIALEIATRTVSASVGISTFPEDAQDAWRLLATADAQMYRRKQGAAHEPAANAARARSTLLERASRAQRRALELQAETQSTVALLHARCGEQVPRDEPEPG